MCVGITTGGSLNQKACMCSLYQINTLLLMYTLCNPDGFLQVMLQANLELHLIILFWFLIKGVLSPHDSCNRKAMLRT